MCIRDRFFLGLCPQDGLLTLVAGDQPLSVREDVDRQRTVIGTAAVSYTHLDVYKRQAAALSSSAKRTVTIFHFSIPLLFILP